MSNEKVPVLVVGGAYTGLSTALGLASRGVRPLLVERRPTTSTLPKAWGLNARTMELLCTVPGMEEELKAAIGDAALPQLRNGASLVDSKLAEIDTAPLLAMMKALTPAPACFLSQATIEKIMRARAEHFGADLRYGTELVSWTQDADQVTATLRDVSDGSEYTVRADYLVAADGHTSPIRNQLGVAVEGGGKVGHIYVVTFEADLSAHFEEGRFSIVGIPGTGTSIIYDGSTLTLWVDYLPDQGQTDADFTEERCLERVRRAVGIPDLECRIVNARPFALNHQLAERFRVGRVLLAGDAAHACPPVGGQGGNLAIQDGYDVAWRLALVLTGQAGPALLDNYQAERRPVVNLTLEREVALLSVSEGRILATSDPTQPIPTPREFLGFRYHSPAIRTEPDDDGSLQEDPGTPTGRPGCRAPHVELTRDGRTLSTHHLFGREFVLLTDVTGADWADAAAKAADRQGITITTHRIGDGLQDEAGAWHTRYDVEPGGAVLVRPDSVIAWRSRTAAANPAHELDEALTAILARPVAP
ncbi:FAD-dependent monooxygenase [Nonomuraea sp. NPDC050404]|uniref:FAD-dependent monooxygenase n=1 Tax=Nonomuraea sp. NPDC050404 TaxID=3155783 RepID=UPI0033F89C83